MSSKRHKNDATPAWVSLPLLTSIVFLILYLGVYRTYRDFRTEKTEVERVKIKFHETFPGLEQAGSLSSSQRTRIVQTANKEKCPCGCGYTLAACLKSDEQCPVREKNLARVADLIRGS